MYHYVRDLKNSRHPEIKGLQVEHFEEQLEHILKHYNVIRMEDLFAAVRGEKTFPKNSLLLTFDDGYVDHYQFVFPVLVRYGIQGSFFVPGKAIQEHRVLDVNKIHFILASVRDKKSLVKKIFSLLDKHRGEHKLESNETYYKKLAVKNRFDSAEVIFIKRLLQKGLPEKLRNSIVDTLFEKYVSKNEEDFSRELYMSTSQLKEMAKKGMYIGSHGWEHYWLDTLSPEHQEKEIKLSLEFLKSLGLGAAVGEGMKEWAMCYPYGKSNDSLLGILKNYGCVVGLTTEVEIADLEKHHNLAFPRLDTNDLPKDKNAKPNDWTRKVIE